MATRANFSLNHRFTDAEPHLQKIDNLEPIKGYEQTPLLPLDIAIAPLIDAGIFDGQDKSYSTMLGKITEAKRRCQNPGKILTQEESASVCLYTESSGLISGVLNKALRDRDPSKLIPWHYYLHLLLTALFKLPWKRGTVWRGVVHNFNQLYQGEKMVFWGITSCSKDLAVANAFLDGSSGPRALFAIETSMGKDISQYSWIDGEGEIVLVPGTSVKISSLVLQNSGQLVVSMKDTRPPHPLLSSPFSNAEMSPLPYGLLQLREKIIKKQHFEKATFKEEMNNVHMSFLATEIETKGDNYAWKVLEFFDCNIVPESGIHLKRILLKLYLNELFLGKNYLGTAGLSMLTKNFANIDGASRKSLKRLDLFDNRIDDGATISIRRLRYIFPHLTTLNLSCNPIRFNAVAELLRNNKTLQVLEIWDIHLSPGGAKYLAEILQHTVLQHLNVGNNAIGYLGCRAIMFSLPHTLIHLDLTAINISQSGINNILHAIKKPCPLKKLIYDGQNLIKNNE